MKNLDKIPILTWALWIVSIVIRFAGFATLAGPFFLLGWMWIYWKQRPNIQKNRKFFDVCAVLVTLLSVAIIVSLAIEALLRNT